MENQNQKWVVGSFLGVSLLVAFVVYSLAAKIAATYDLEARVRHLDYLLQGGAGLLALVLFIILFRHQQANQFLHEVLTETSRVTWPGRKETTAGTVVVIVMVLISGLVLGGMDYFFTRVIQWIF